MKIEINFNLKGKGSLLVKNSVKENCPEIEIAYSSYSELTKKILKDVERYLLSKFEEMVFEHDEETFVPTNYQKDFKILIDALIVS